MHGWPIPFVTGHKYKIHWGTGLDFEEMQLYMSENWKEDDKNLYLVHNWTDVREAIDVHMKNGDEAWFKVENDTIAGSTADWANGQHVIYNETDVRETHLVLNGKNRSSNPYDETHIKLTGHRCLTNCVEDVDFDVDGENFFRYWSDTANWPDETLPAEGDDVHIEPAWKMVYDIEGESPIFQLVRVNGKLTFDPDVT
jgi:hypothetical protein